MIKIAILASGGGSNAHKILEHFKDHSEIKVNLIGCNKSNAGVLKYANDYGTDALVFNKTELASGIVLENLLAKNVDYIVLAGFLALIPEEIVNAFENRIINIHPSLLPKYGGKGMYGNHVHAAVKENAETRSGMTIHLVNEEFDKGMILFQAATALNSEDTISQIQQKVLVKEHQFFASTIEAYILSKKNPVD